MQDSLTGRTNNARASPRPKENASKLAFHNPHCCSSLQSYCLLVNLQPLRLTNTGCKLTLQIQKPLSPMSSPLTCILYPTKSMGIMLNQRQPLHSWIHLVCRMQMPSPAGAHLHGLSKRISACRVGGSLSHTLHIADSLCSHCSSQADPSPCGPFSFTLPC